MMKNLICFLFFCLLLITKIGTSAGWAKINTGIIDNFNNVQFWGNTGIIAGDKGLYYTTTGGNNAADWKRFAVSKQNVKDSILYNNCMFYNISPSNTNEAYVCGWDKINNKAVIFFINASTLTYKVMYVGTVGSKLNAVKFNSNHLYAVGDKGLIIWSDLTIFQEVTSSTTKNLYCVDGDGNHVSIGGDGVFVDGNDMNNTLQIKVIDKPVFTMNDVYILNSSDSYGVGNAVYTITKNGDSTAAMTNYDFGNLQARSLFNTLDAAYVGTSHGIFKSDASYSFLELQPTSASFYINDVAFETRLGGNGYAVGKNGVFLKTTDGGGATKPYASINLKGTCTNGDITLNGNPGTASDCKWKINNVQISSQCNDTHTFTSPGQYTVTYIVSNASNLADTTSQLIHIVDPPQINLPVTIADSILCKQQPLSITINTTQAHFLYNLKSNPDGKIIASDSGNAGKLILTSVPQNESGSFYIQVKSMLADCQRDFTDSIHVLVEKTRADFSSSLVNAMIGEAIDFAQQSKTAAHYKWTFGPNASSSTNLTEKPKNVKFLSLGQTTVGLIASSDNGCVDTIIKKGPYITAEPPQNDSCWGFALNGTDASQMSNYTPDVAHQILVKDGYLICGAHYSNFFTSRRGNNLGKVNNGGGYIAKYSKNGILKWVDYGTLPTYDAEGYENRPLVYSMAVDPKSDHIYIIGKSRSNEYYHMTDGDSIQLNNTSDYIAGFIAKLDASGHLIWSATMSGELKPGKIKIDNAGNLITTGIFFDKIKYSLNGKDTTLQITKSSSNKASYIIKIDTNGVFKWFSYIDNIYVNPGSDIHDFDIDNNNNLLITGGVERSVVFHSADNSVTDSIFVPNDFRLKMYVAKYDQNGVFKWKMMGTINRSYGRFYGGALTVDDQGNSYLTADNNCYMPEDTSILFNADNSIYRSTVGSFVLLKINPEGKLVWMTGSRQALYGIGYGIDVSGNEISVLGQLANFQSPWSGKMASTDGNDLDFSIEIADFFVGNYDTNGILKKLIRTGPNPIGSLFFYNNFYARDEYGDYYLSGNIRNYDNGGPYYIGNDSITTNGVDGFMIKISQTGCNNGVITSIEDNSGQIQLGELSVYPNPAVDEVFISLKNFDKKYDVKIFNSIGACIYSGQLTSSTLRLSKSDFGNIKAGLYLISLNSEDNIHQYSQKIIIMD